MRCIMNSRPDLPYKLSLSNFKKHSKLENAAINVLPLIAAGSGRPQNIRHPKSQYAATRHIYFSRQSFVLTEFMPASTNNYSIPLPNETNKLSST